MLQPADKVVDTIARFEMVAPGDRVLVAVSGGPDSVCLLDVLVGLKEHMDLALQVAHVDHMTRDGESAADAEFVQQLAAGYGISCEIVRVNVESNRTPAESFETAARRMRYAALTEVARRCGAARLATGHTADDQAETVLMRILRGTGPRGVVGIPPVVERDGITVIRPLITVWRREVRHYVDERGLAWREDSTNRMTCYLRNRVRLQLIPELEREFNPAVKEALVRLADLARDEQDLFSRYAHDLAGSAVVREQEEEVHIDRSAYRSLPAAIGRLCVMAWSSSVLGRPWRGTADAVERGVALLSSESTTGQIHLPDGVCIRLEYDVAVLRRTVPSTEQVESLEPVTLPVPGRAAVEWAGLMFTTRTLPRSEAPRDIRDACRRDVHFFDADRTAGQLVVRNRRRGDKFQPVGLDGTIKLSDFFINRKVPARLRGSVPILVCDSGIVWVVGYDADETCAVLESTTRVVEVRCDPLL